MKWKTGVKNHMSKQLAYTVFRPAGELRAALFIVHGMQEHQERYEKFAHYLNDRGIGVVTYDLPGHGKTDPEEENRGWFGSERGWMNLVSSAVDIAVLTRKEFPKVPLIYFGHSMGTMVARTFLQKYDQLIDAMVLSGAPNYQPAAALGKTIAAAVCKAKGEKGHSALLDTLATGSFNKAVSDPRTPLDWLSYNEENVDRYIADPDCGFPFTCRGYYDLFTGMVQMNRVKDYMCTKKDLPIYFVAGEDDPCTGGIEGLNSSVDTLHKAGYEHIDLKQYPHMRHETLQEKDNEAVMADIEGWLEENVIR